MGITINKVLRENALLKRKVNPEKSNKIILNNVITTKLSKRRFESPIETIKNHTDNNLKEAK